MNTTATIQPESNSWDLVASFIPRLKSHITICRHHYRGEVSYVLEDAITGQRYRFSQSAYEIVGRINGKSSCEEIYEYVQGKDGPLAPEKHIIADIIHQLLKMEALAGNIPQSLQKNVPQKYKNPKNTLWEQVKKSPLFLRFPLFNPSSILRKYHSLFRPLYSKIFLTILVTLFITAFCKLFLIWPELTSNAVDRIFTQHNLFIIWILYPIVKTVHEFAHAFSVKYYGGEVTEMGIMLLLFVPVPYVNASDSASLPNKWQRITVAGSGILAELTLASIALLLWSAVEPGLVRTVFFNTILICGFSTLVFNGNPLVRFDGYYILSDLIEIPNLAAKSGSLLWHHFLRLITGVKVKTVNECSAAEKRWFLVYGVASFFYRFTIYGSIFYLFASNLGPIGALIGVVAIAQLLLLPFMRKLRPVLRSRDFISKRKKILSFLCLFTMTAVLIICLIPLPYNTFSEGVVWLPEENLVKMKTSGIIKNIVAAPGAQIKKGDLLFECKDLDLRHNILLLESQLKELELKETATFARDPFGAKVIRERRVDLLERLKHKKQQEEDLIITSPHSGNFIIHSPKELTGSFFKQGEPLAFIQDTASTIRTLISQEDIDPILQHVSRIDIFVVTEPGKTFSGSLLSRNPQSTFQLPSAILGITGGGKILLNPEDNRQLTTLEEMFQLDITLEEPLIHSFPESRAYIKFHHGLEPLLFRWIRDLRQLFLTQFRG